MKPFTVVFWKSCSFLFYSQESYLKTIQWNPQHELKGEEDDITWDLMCGGNQCYCLDHMVETANGNTKDSPTTVPDISKPTTIKSEDGGEILRRDGIYDTGQDDCDQGIPRVSAGVNAAGPNDVGQFSRYTLDWSPLVAVTFRFSSTATTLDEWLL